MKATLRGPGAVDAFRWAAGCLEALARRIAREEAVLQERTKAERANRRLLLEARKGVRVLERFREKQFGLHRRDAELEERKFLDEIGGTRAMGA